MIGQDGHVQKEGIAPMLSREENELLTRVGPGTPAGEMLRRYWWPVGFSENVMAKGSPTRVRLLGEDLVLFRDGDGKLGLSGSPLFAPGNFFRIRPSRGRWHPLLLSWLALRCGRAMSGAASGA